MENNNENNGFSYTYSAKEQQELKKIRAKYMSNTESEDKMQRLRRLDRSVTQKAEVIALCLGIIGTLILGFGMSLFMSSLGDAIGLPQTMAMVIGVAVGIVGGALAALAYPAYHAVIKRERAKIAPEIIRLTDELMK